MPAYTRITLSDLRDMLTEKVGNNSVYWGSEEKRDGVNEALCVLQAMTCGNSKSFSVNALSGTWLYDVPKQIASVTRTLYNNVPLTPISVWELDMGFPAWQGMVGTPQFWAPVGIDKVALYPQPASGSIRFEGYSEHVRLLADGDFLQLGEEELTRLLDYAHHYLTFKEGMPELEATMGGFKRFLNVTVLRNARLLGMTFYRKFMGLDKGEGERPTRNPYVKGGVRETT